MVDFIFTVCAVFTLTQFSVVSLLYLLGLTASCCWKTFYRMLWCFFMLKLCIPFRCLIALDANFIRNILVILFYSQNYGLFDLSFCYAAVHGA